MSTSILTTSSIFAKYYEGSKLQDKLVPRFSLFAPSRFRKRKRPHILERFCDPSTTYKFSKLISIYFFEEFVERI